MPWKVSHVVNERMKLVTRYEAGERMTDLAREFGISRKTAYKILKRYRESGPKGLYDLSRAPHSSPQKTPKAMVKLVLDLKDRYPTWGAKKIRWKLRFDHVGLAIPSAHTIHRILDREGLVKRRKRKKRILYSSNRLRSSRAPNDIWSADFKGHFRLGTKSYCYPLTISDHYSRFLLGCEALSSTKMIPATTFFRRVFEEYGLPKVIRTDNGAPFASWGLLGLTKLSAYWLKLGIELERIDPGHPEQNGRHERMHLTLKQDTARPPAANMLAQQERFDNFRTMYNEERPHEALMMRRPREMYQASNRSLPPENEPLEYPLHDLTLFVYGTGVVRVPRSNRLVHLSNALAREYVGLREIDDDTWLVSFSYVNLGVIRPRERRLQAFDLVEEE